MSQSDPVFDSVTTIVYEVLGRAEGREQAGPDTAMLGAIPEFDSMAVVSVLNAIEEEFGITIEDDEVDAGIFETFGTLSAFVGGKVSG